MGRFRLRATYFARVGKVGKAPFGNQGFQNLPFGALGIAPIPTGAIHWGLGPEPFRCRWVEDCDRFLFLPPARRGG